MLGVCFQVDAGHQGSKATGDVERANRANQLEGKGELIRSFRYKGTALAGNAGLSPAFSGVGKHTFTQHVGLLQMQSVCKVAGAALFG